MNKILGYILLSLFTWGYFSVPTPKAEIIEEENTDFINDYHTHEISDSLLATKYNAVKEQCDDTPFITADNSNICPIKLNNYELRWVALSRDMLERYPYGSKIIVECDIEKLNGVWEVHDTMNKRYSERIDFLVPLNDNYNFNRPTKVKITKLID